ncbi:MAG: hypothetical protein KTR31_39360 [Myxococcales bacterium]|nr:hypothetical protein [Myxococcales bacterium]
MASDLRVGVAGATGALGVEILGVLNRARWRPDTVLAFARASTTTSHVEYGDDRLAVDDVEEMDPDALDALILALPYEAARDVGQRALRAGLAVVDASGALAVDADLPVVVPWINPEALMDVPDRAVVLPSAESTLLASVLGPLARAGVTGRARATLLASASSYGRRGIDELSQQVVALFNSGTPPRAVFEQGLAFDLLAATDPVEDSGWTSRESRIVEQLSRLVPHEGLVSQVTWVGVPVFSGVAAALVLDPTRRVDAGLVERILTDGGVVLSDGTAARGLPRPRSVDGRPFAHVGRIRVSEDGGVHLWLVMDNLRTTATAAAAATAALLQVGAKDLG